MMDETMNVTMNVTSLRWTCELGFGVKEGLNAGIQYVVIERMF